MENGLVISFVSSFWGVWFCDLSTKSSFFLFGIEELMLYGCCIYVESRQYMHILKNPMHLWFRKEGAHVKKTVDKTA